MGINMKRTIIILQIIAIIIILSIPEQANEDKFYVMSSTAYCPGPECCAPWDDGKTFTGADAGRGCIAIDPKARILKMGQKVFVEGYGYGECNDVGSAIKGWKIDLCFEIGRASCRERV